jgi:hypothetical protein
LGQETGPRISDLRRKTLAKGTKLGISTVRFSELEGNWRLDAEYYQPAYFEMAAVLEAYPATAPLDALSGGIVCGPFGSALSKAEYTPSGVPLIRVADLSGFIVTGERELVFVSEETAKRLDRYLIEPDDIAVSQRGTIAMFALMSDDFPYWLISANLIAIRQSQQLNPFYLNVFLNSKYGTGQLHRLLSGQVQPKVTTDDVKSIAIPIPGVAFQGEIERLVKESHGAMKRSHSLYRQAEQLLLDELGLNELDLPDGLHSAATLTKVWTADRVDSEYFQTKYLELEKALQRSAQQHNLLLAQIREFSAPLKYGTSEKFEYLEEGIPFLRITDLQGYFFEPDSLTYISPSVVDSLGDARVRTGDVIISRTGTLGVAVAIPETLSRSVFGSYFIRSRPDSNVVVPSYLALYLNSPLGRIQVQRLSTGAIQTNLTIPAIENLKVIIPDKGLQEGIVAIVGESTKARERAKELLKQAMHKVEALIESEATHG